MRANGRVIETSWGEPLRPPDCAGVPGIKRREIPRTLTSLGRLNLELSAKSSFLHDLSPVSSASKRPVAVAFPINQRHGVGFKRRRRAWPTARARAFLEWVQTRSIATAF